jgi:NADH-quinone oxidoreductase subunit J
MIVNAATIVFALVAAIAIGSAVGMLYSRNTVYSALYLVVNFASVAVFYLTLGAPFIALSQIAVYAGAIMVLFLFVIMLLGAEVLPPRETLPWQRPLALMLGSMLFFALGYFIFTSGFNAGLSESPLEAGTTEFLITISNKLFTEFLLPFEVTSILLLTAMIGAIILTRKEKGVQG